MPQQWSLTVAGYTNGDCDDCNNLNGTFILTIVFGTAPDCFWDSPHFNLCESTNWWRLDCDGTNFNLFPKNGGVIAYVLPIASFNCLGSNTLPISTGVTVCGGAPASLTITPV